MKLSVALIIATAMMMMIIPSVHATGGPAPTLSTDQADCFRNVVSDGDIFCLIRYDLPTFVTATPPPASAEAWCAELVDQDGCTADPVEPTNETSQITDSAFVTLYQNCGVDCSTGTLESQVRTPRINFALGGAYLAPGHAVTWGDPTVNGCVQSSTTLFTVASISCIPVTWNSAAVDQASQLVQLGSDLVGDLRSLETDRNLSLFSYVSNNLITSAGRVLSIEALSVMDQIIPERFQAAIESSQDQDFTTPSGTPLALQSSLDATASATDLPTAFTNLGTILFGISGGAMATLFFLMLGIIAFFKLHGMTGDIVMGGAGLAAVAMVGIYARGPTVSVIAVAAVGLSLVAGMFLVGKIRT